MASQHRFERKPLAFITGASNGIGLELAKQFAVHGFDLILTGQREHIKDAAYICRRFGAETVTIQADLAKSEGVVQLWEQVLALRKPLDAVAINAGVGLGGAFVGATKLADEMHMIDLNIKSTVHLAKLVAPAMVTRGQGRMLLTSSIAGTMPTPFEAVYGATKAFIHSFASSLRSELAETGVTVTTLLPGSTETNFFHRAGMDRTKVGSGPKDDPEDVARDAFAALMDGDATVVAGSFKNKIFASPLVPDALKAELHKQLAESASPKH